LESLVELIFLKDALDIINSIKIIYKFDQLFYRAVIKAHSF
jgi:hypothetical protein